MFLLTNIFILSVSITVSSCQHFHLINYFECIFSVSYQHAVTRTAIHFGMDIIIILYVKILLLFRVFFWKIQMKTSTASVCFLSQMLDFFHSYYFFRYDFVINHNRIMFIRDNGIVTRFYFGFLYIPTIECSWANDRKKFLCCCDSHDETSNSTTAICSIVIFSDRFGCSNDLQSLWNINKSPSCHHLSLPFPIFTR